MLCVLSRPQNDICAGDRKVATCPCDFRYGKGLHDKTDIEIIPFDGHSIACSLRYHIRRKILQELFPTSTNCRVCSAKNICWYNFQHNNWGNFMLEKKVLRNLCLEINDIRASSIKWFNGQFVHIAMAPVTRAPYNIPNVTEKKIFRSIAIIIQPFHITDRPPSTAVH